MKNKEVYKLEAENNKKEFITTIRINTETEQALKQLLNEINNNNNTKLSFNKLIRLSLINLLETDTNTINNLLSSLNFI